ncbi:MAG: CDP-alcohol phosphatidyltransferase family protein [Micromonosporaceae bacterium]|nr:CDP-alcohol phosphatidyltransferase family protein [Micromonosporaceae bacterium]
MAKIFSVFGRAGLTRVFDPIARALLRAGVSPDAVTVAGTVAIVATAIGLAARGHLVWASLIITVLAFTDMVDGSMARQRGRAGKFGAFLDSTMDRIADGAVFGSVVYWLGTQGRHLAAAAALICLVTGQIISYAKARAESLGMTANVGIAERAERLVLVGIGALLTGLGVRYALDVALWLLAAVSIFTVGQRMTTVYRQDRRAVAERNQQTRPERAGRVDQ